MKQSFLSAFPLTLLFFHIATAQKIIYSDPGKEGFNRVKYNIITKHDDKLLVYKAIYFHTFLQGGNTINRRQTSSNFSTLTEFDPSGLHPNNFIEQSTLCIYDSNMHVLAEKSLPIPRGATGIHFLVYDDFFYAFYQYLHIHTIYCMAVKLSMDGNIIEPPVKMDSTRIPGIQEQSQIYSVLNSEDKQHILLFRVNIYHHPTRIKAVWFDKDLHATRNSELSLYVEASQFLSEYHIDNEGNFVFVGMNGKAKSHDPVQAALFTVPAHEDSIYTTYFVPPSISVDNIHLLIDNLHKRYILTSFYSKRPQATIEGLFCLVHDAERRSAEKGSLTVLSGNMLREIKNNGIKISLNDYYIQDLHLRRNGSFTIGAQELGVTPEHEIADRWLYLPAEQESIAKEFAWYDAYDNDQYYPWTSWRKIGLFMLNRYSFMSRGTLIISFDSTGVEEWTNVIHTPQHNMANASLGYKTFTANGLLYFLFNTRVRQRSFLTARTIDADGRLDTDPRFKEDLALRDQDNAYECFPRLAKLVDAGELIVPCRKGGYFCLAKINF
jgi:hypothetical protein